MPERQEHSKPKEDPFPRRIEFMHPSLTHHVPRDRENWISEANWDGLRVMAYVRPSDIRLYTARQDEISKRFPRLRNGLEGIARSHTLILDGCLLYLGSNHHDRNKQMTAQIAQAGKNLIRLMSTDATAFIIYDLLYLDGEKLVDRKLTERKRLLRRAIHISYRRYYGISPNFYLDTDDEGAVLLKETAKTQGIGEIFIRDKRSSYKPGIRSKSWLKYQINNR